MSLPVIINTASNAVLNLLAPNSQAINVTSLMWPSLSVSGTALGGALTTALLMGLAIDIIPPFFGVAVVKDKEARADFDIIIILAHSALVIFLTNDCTTEENKTANFFS